MPKIRCRGCETVLNAPDKARGKVIKCPKCSTKIKVPAGEGAPTAKKKKAAPQKKKRPKPEDDFLGGLGAINELDLEDDEETICPYCAAEMEDIEEDPVCRNCGMDIETGKMDVKEKKKRSIKGPDPALFYKNVFSDSWQFILKEKRLCFKTGTNWMIFAVLCSMTSYMAFVFCQRAPTKTFWGSLAFLTTVAIPGWYWLLSMKVIRSTYLNEDFRSDRLNVDMFQSIASGIRALMWPVIVMLPIAGPIVIGIYFLSYDALMDADPTIIGVILGMLYVPGMFLLPAAMVQMTGRYTYKGWILWELSKILVRVFVPTLFFLMVCLVALIPVAIVAGPIFFLIKDVNPFTSEVITGITHKITMWIVDIAGMGQVTEESMTYALMKGPLNIMFAFLVYAPIAYVAGFPAVFTMRANGLFGYYNKRKLDLVEQIAANKIATFWVRFLAHVIDWIFTPLAGFLVTANDKALMLQWFVNAIVLLIYFFSPQMLWLGGILWPLYTIWFYWAVQESSQIKTTLGKDAFGLLIVREEDEGQITLKQASIRFFLRFLAPLHIIAAFRPDKHSFHDLATKTKVVWKGDK